MNPLAWILDSLKAHPEPAQLPDLSEATPLELAEARSRLAQFAQTATELRRLVDVELAGALQGSALNYGGQIIRSANGRGTAKVTDSEMWWQMVEAGLAKVEDQAGLLAALYPADAVRLTAVPKLAAALGVEPATVRDTMFHYDPPTSPLSVMPKDKAPRYLQDLAEGEIR